MRLAPAHLHKIALTEPTTEDEFLHAVAIAIARPDGDDIADLRELPVCRIERLRAVGDGDDYRELAARACEFCKQRLMVACEEQLVLEMRELPQTTGSEARPLCMRGDLAKHAIFIVVYSPTHRPGNRRRQLGEDKFRDSVAVQVAQPVGR